MIALALLLAAMQPPPPPPPPTAHPSTDTPCAKCHSPEGWAKVTFDHSRTGFALLGEHARTSCKACHGESLDRTLPTGCAGCHRDQHRGELGARCEGCHDARSWASSFGADAHRQTNFPLSGRHAFIPCLECHPDVRDRQFTGNAVPCRSCHDADLLRTQATGLDHFKLPGFTGRCLNCHNAWSFKHAKFTGHDRCFPISSGPHASVDCLNCHTAIPPGFTPGTCSTETATLCTRCHAHDQGRTDAVHQEHNVPGYHYAPQECSQCHKLQMGQALHGLKGLSR